MKYPSERAYKKRYYAKTANAERGSKPYQEFEEQMILSKDYSDSQLSELLRRSVMAIQIKRSKLKKR